MDKTTIVLPSARAIRHEQFLIKEESVFLPNFMTMADFISQLCVVKGFKPVDKDTRVLLLLKAANFKEFSSLKIEKNFFTFTKNSSYLFKFFEELSAEMYDISQLESSDTYAEYEEHIAILHQLYKRYEKICNEKKILDKIFLPKIYHFNKNYAKTHKTIEVKADGYLTNFELKLLQECCEFCEVIINFTTSKFNTKMQKKLFDIGFELKENYIYKLSLNNKTIISKTKRNINQNIYSKSFTEPLLQIAYVKQKIYEGIKKGYTPERIAVVLADEKMAQKLSVFDSKSNLNFAMGKPFTQTTIYKTLHATCQILDQNSQENYARLQRIGDSLYKKLHQNYLKSSHEFDTIKFLNDYKNSFEDKTQTKIFEEELYTFARIMPHIEHMNVKSILSLFLQRISQRSIDDTRGGKITVMGVLETRSVEFDLVIITDFDDRNVPKRSDKDMFLNTKTRKSANLPTSIDRENLQKHYYDLLISNSKEVAISYVKSNQSGASAFLKLLNIKNDENHNDKQYANILFPNQIIYTKSKDEIILQHSFKEKKISSSRLKTFLECKRKYYYKYIKHIDSHEIPKDMPKEHEIGTSIHLALSRLYTKKNSYTSVDELKKDLHRELDLACGDSELDKYMIAIQKKRLDKFCIDEVKRFESGWHVESCEKNLECDFAGAKLTGRIDRIDKKGDELFVFDYKTGNYKLYNKNNFKDATDFQLEFYYILSSKLGNVTGCAFYDLKDIKIVPENLMEEKLSTLKSNITEILKLKEINFEMCEDTKKCIYCDYATICLRG